MASPRPAVRALTALIALVLLLGTGLAALVFWLVLGLVVLLPEWVILMPD